MLSKKDFLCLFIRFSKILPVIPNYASHVISENHNFNSNFNILYIQNKDIRLSYLESLEINKLSNQFK